MNKRGIGIFAVVLIVLAVGVAGFTYYKSSSENPLFAPQPSGSVRVVACSDSDGGNNPFIKGTATVTYQNGSTGNFTDYCQNISSVHEYFCQGSSLSSVNFVCNTYGDYICQNGACVVTPTYLLSVTKQGSGQGFVLSTPVGINCGSDCSENYNFGTSVLLTATPSSGSVFGGWIGGGCSGTGNCTLLMNLNKSVIAVFNSTNSTNQTTQYLLTVNKTGNGSGTVTSSPAGINCGSDCTQNYNSGTVVALTATPSVGSGFSGWSGACSGASPVCNLVMNSNKNAIANFTYNQTNQTLLPDLDIISFTSVVGLESNFSNQSYQLTLTAMIKNIGTASAGVSTTRFNVLPVGGQKLISISPIGVNQTRTVFVIYDNMTAGNNYNSTANADWFNNVTESNESNNGAGPIYFTIP